MSGIKIDPLTQRLCGHCYYITSIDNFYKHNKSACKECCKKRQRRYNKIFYGNNQDKMKMHSKTVYWSKKALLLQKELEELEKEIDMVKKTETMIENDEALTGSESK